MKKKEGSQVDIAQIAGFYPTGHEAHFSPGHPERPERIEVIRAALQEAGLWQQFNFLEPVEVDQHVLEAVHEPAYLALLQEACRRGLPLDSDTYTTPASWDLALRSAGGAIAVARAVWGGEASTGFALNRPPGHHATRRRGMGFCLLNNIALAVEDLIQHQGAERLAIVDLDLHHGNGTQDIFWERGDVLFLSTHQMPLFPGTGFLDESGAGAGAGCTVNLPLPPYSGDEAFQTIMDEIILPVLDRFAPQMVLCSIGFDTHWRDPLGQLLVSADVYGHLIRRLVQWTDQHSQGKLALFLEGGYDLEAGAVCALAITAALLKKTWEDPIGPSPIREDMLWKRVLLEARQMLSIT